MCYPVYRIAHIKHLLLLNVSLNKTFPSFLISRTEQVISFYITAGLEFYFGVLLTLLSILRFFKVQNKNKHRKNKNFTLLKCHSRSSDSRNQLSIHN